MNTQNARVLAALRRHSLTMLDASHMGIYRLSARIYELRVAGYDIRTEMESHGGGRHARYFLKQQRPVEG